MDLISRETIANELEKHQYSREFCIEHRIDFAMDMGMVRIIVNSIPSAFEEMTNRDVLKALFPIDENKGARLTKVYVDHESIESFELFTTQKWLDSPYKGQRW